MHLDKFARGAETRAITIGISSKELTARHKAWKQPKPGYMRCLLTKYAHLLAPRVRAL